MLPEPGQYLSYIRITTYQQCPLWSYFRYVAGLPERTIWSSLVFENAVHRAVEHPFNEWPAGNELTTIDALVSQYDRAWQESY